jgi:hypothetical protein
MEYFFNRIIDVRDSTELVGNPFPPRMPPLRVGRPSITTYATLIIERLPHLATLAMRHWRTAKGA